MDGTFEALDMFPDSMHRLMSYENMLGGLLTESIGWRAIFWVNVPIVLAAIALTARFVPESRAAHARRPDPVGQILVVILLGSVTTAVIEAPRLGWTSGAVVGLGAAAVVALVALLAEEAGLA